MQLVHYVRPLALRLRFPASLLIAFLQRSPAVRVLTAAEDWVQDSPLSNVLRASGLAAASLGAVHTLAGATSAANVQLVIISGPGSPQSAKTGTPITPVAFGVSGAGANTPNSWTLVSNTPPGLTFSGRTTPGTVNVSFPNLSGTPTTSGNYTVEFYATYAGVSTATYGYTVNVAVGGPVFTVQPTNKTASVGSAVTFTSNAVNATSYQWTFNGVPISGATNASLVLTNVQTSAAGDYQVIASDPGGASDSNVAILTVTGSPPSFAIQPAPVTVAAGSTAVLQVAATGSPAPTFQWLVNNTPIPGATASRLVIANASTANIGNYYCTLSSSSGSASSNVASLGVTTTSNPGRIGNISVLSNFVAGQTLTVGFVSGGSGTAGAQNLLIRATGPSLAAVSGLTGTMTDPSLSLIPLGATAAIAANDNWGSSPTNAQLVAAADSATGAFTLLTGSLDAALVDSVTSGNYSVAVTGTGPGVALTEVYDDTPVGTYTLATPRLLNISCNSAIATGGFLTAGFTIGGSTAKTVLIRASGPTLAASFGLAGTMADPQVVVYDSNQNVLASNAGWGGDPQITAADAAAGAFPFASSASLDSAVLLTLPPGGYSAVVSSVSGGGGIGLVEVYEIQ